MEINHYFDNNVVSIGFESEQGPVSSGVMAPGEYTFGTSQAERIVVVHGKMTVQLPGSDAWQTIAQGAEFNVVANVEFNVKIAQPCAYLCYYG